MIITFIVYIIEEILSFQITPGDENEMDPVNNCVKHVIYQWNGLEANAEIRNKAEIYARKLFQDLECESSMYVQMTETDEPPHFLQIFKGKLIIFQDESNIQKFYATDSNNNNKLQQNHNEDNFELSRKFKKLFTDTSKALLARTHFILKVTGDTSYNSKAIEVYPLIMMSSRECYILKTKEQAWIWCGQSSTGDEKEIAKTIGSLLGITNTLVLEHKEPKEFWQSVSTLISQTVIPNSLNDTSSTKSYSSSTASSGSSGASSTSGRKSPSLVNNRTNSKIKANNEAPLYLVWLQCDKLHRYELIGYEQTDLNPYSIYILDAVSIIYVWMGKFVGKRDAEKYLSIAYQYIEEIMKLRRATTAISIIRQNAEPNVFTGFFNSWNRNYWNVR